MPLDARIPMSVQAPQIESPLNRYARVMQLQNMKQKGQMNQMSIDAAERQQRTADQVRNALMAAQSAGKSPEETINDIMMIDPSAAEPFLEASKLKAQTGKETALTDRYKAQREETLRKVMRDRFVPIMAIGDPAMQQQAYQAWRQESIAIDPDDESVLPEQFDPKLGQAILDSAESFTDRTTISATDAAKLDQGERRLAETESYHREKLAQGPATRGDSIETKWAKDQVRPIYDEQGKVVRLEPIPGGKADPDVQRQTQDVKLTAKERHLRNVAFPKVQATTKRFAQNADLLKEEMGKLRNHPGLKSMLGYLSGRLGQAHPDKDARAASALFDKILAMGQFNELGEMKQMSSVGSAGLGPVSDFEQRSMREMFTAMKPTLDYDDFVKILDDTVSQVESSKTRITDQFDLDYEYRNPAGDEWEVVE